MRKIRLEIDALQVESFTAAEQAVPRGTVRGLASLYWEDCSPSETCEGAGYPCGPSEQSCGGTCERTCHNTCPMGCGQSGGCSNVTQCYIGTTCIDMPGTGVPDC